MGYDQKDWGRLYGGVRQGFPWKEEDGLGEQHEQSRELSKVQDGRDKLLVLLDVNREDCCREFSAGTGGGST